MASFPQFILTNVVNGVWAPYKVAETEDKFIHLLNKEGDCTIVPLDQLGDNWSPCDESVFIGKTPVPRGCLRDDEPALPDYIMFRNGRNLSERWPIFLPHAVLGCTPDTVKLQDQCKKVFNVSRNLLCNGALSGTTATEGTDFWPIPEDVYNHMPKSKSTLSGQHGFACYRCNVGGVLMMCEGFGCNETVCAPCWSKTVAEEDAWFCPKCQPQNYPHDCMQLKQQFARPRGRAPANCVWSSTTGKWCKISNVQSRADQSAATGKQTKKRPRGRAPAGKTWSNTIGDWVALASQAPASKKRPRGRAPAGMTWCNAEGQWKPIAKRACTHANSNGSDSDDDVAREEAQVSDVEAQVSDVEAQVSDVEGESESASVKDARKQLNGTVSHYFDNASACTVCHNAKGAMLINCAGCNDTMCAECCVANVKHPWSMAEHALQRWWCKTCAMPDTNITLPFASLLYAWVNSEENNTVVEWALEGESFIVHTNTDLDTSIRQHFASIQGDGWVWLQKQLLQHGFGICGDSTSVHACKIVHGDSAFKRDAQGLLRNVKLVHAAPCMHPNARNETFATAGEALFFRAQYEKAFGTDAWQAMKPQNWDVYAVHERLQQKVGKVISVEFSRGKWWRMTIVSYDPDEHTFVAKGVHNGSDFTSVIGLDNADETKFSAHDPSNRIRITPFKYVED